MISKDSPKIGTLVKFIGNIYYTIISIFHLVIKYLGRASKKSILYNIIFQINIIQTIYYPSLK